MFINTDIAALVHRHKAVEPSSKRILIANYVGTTQESDLTEPANCQGFGRIRHFHRIKNQWPSDPLPIDPACKALGLPRADSLNAQVFQIGVCNWRCWYCFVPENLLSGDPKHTQHLSVSQLVDYYLGLTHRPIVIDLTGGQPDLAPEWVPWMMRELLARGLQDEVYLWSNDNLSTDYFWRYLSQADQELVATYRNYGKVGCFKGFSEESFSFNTSVSPEFFDKQFDLMERYLTTDIDIYAYVTFTAPRSDGLRDKMRRFIDRLQAIHPNMPLRTIPLKIRVYSPTRQRMNPLRERALVIQEAAIEAWQSELESRFTSEELGRNITDISLRS